MSIDPLAAYRKTLKQSKKPKTVQVARGSLNLQSVQVYTTLRDMGAATSYENAKLMMAFARDILESHGVKITQDVLNEQKDTLAIYCKRYPTSAARKDA